MKQLLNPSNVTFSASGKTVTFAGTIPSTIGHILHITNVTQGSLYFQPQAGSAYSGTYASPVLTLACITAGHADSDKLTIFYDDGCETYQQGFPIPNFDNKLVGYTSASVLSSVIYKMGATAVATLTYGYTGTNLTTITKS